MPKTSNKLTVNRPLKPREKRFIKYFVETGRVGESALRAGYSDPKYGTALKAQDKIQTAIVQMMEKIGLTDEAVLKSLKAGVKAKTPVRYAKLEPGQEEPQVLVPSSPDHLNRPRYIDIYCKLRKHYAPEGTTQDNRVTMIQINMNSDRVKGLLDAGKISRKEAKELEELQHEPVRDAGVVDSDDKCT